MNKTLRIVVFFSIITITAFAVSPSYCQDKQIKPKIKTFEGRVSYINWVTSTVRLNGVGTMEFYVPKDTPMRKLGAKTWLANVNILDDLIIRYYEDPSGMNTAVDITIEVV